MGTWQSLFSLRSHHEFFGGGVCSTLDFVPTPGCDHLLLNAGVALRKGDGRLTAYIDTDRIDALPTDALFDFCAHSRDRHFLNYTDGLSPHEGGTYYLCNTPGDSAADGRLSRSDHVSGDDLVSNDRIPPELRPARPPAPLLLIRIAIDSRTAKAPSYSIPFRARRTHWHYYITGPGIAGADLYVSDTNGEEAFEHCGERELPNGRLACHFRSKEPLPLLHEQPARYSLYVRDNARPIVKWLPMPSPRSLGGTPLNGAEELASQMFVNL